MSIAIGIDLGTTNSVVACMKNDHPQVLANRYGDRLTPSAVYLAEDGGIVVGRDAKARREQSPDRTFTSFKRRMGTDYRRVVDGHSYSPEEISGMLLRTLKEDAELTLGEIVDSAVITVPANFNSDERQATKSAGEIADLQVRRVLNEPTAAALAYGHSEKLSSVMVVFDLGGGTFDMSVVLAEEDIFEVVYSLGDNRLGGDDINIRLLGHLVEELRRTHDLDVSENTDLVRLLLSEAVAAKHRLTESEETTVRVPNIGISGGKRIDFEATVNRDDLRKACGPVLAKIKRYAETLIDALGAEDIKCRCGQDLGNRLEKCDILLVGGETRVLPVREVLAENLRGRIITGVNPDEVVALGAAIQAGIIARHIGVQDIVLIDSTSLSLGVELKGGGFSRLIPANTPLPVTQTQEYFTVEDDQTDVWVKVYQGEHSVANQNKFLGDFTLYGIPPRPAGDSPILLTYDLDANDILSVEARDKATNQRANLVIKGSQIISPTEVERMKEDAKTRHAANEATLRRNRLQELSEQAFMIIATRVNPLRDIIKPEYANRLDELVAALQEALEDDNLLIIEKYYYDLYHALPKKSAKFPSLALQIFAHSGLKEGEWNELEVVLANRGTGSAGDVQVTVSGQAETSRTGATAAICPGGSQSIPISVCPTKPGSAVPLVIAVEYTDEASIPYSIRKETTVEVARTTDVASSRAQTLINIGEIIHHAGIGDLHTEKSKVVHGDNIGGGKVGDVVATRSTVDFGFASTHEPPVMRDNTAVSLSDGTRRGFTREAKSDETVACPNCSIQVPKDYSFCSGCGAPLSSKCGECSTQVAATDRFCRNCGVMLRS